MPKVGVSMPTTSRATTSKELIGHIGLIGLIGAIGILGPTTKSAGIKNNTCAFFVYRRRQNTRPRPSATPSNLEGESLLFSGIKNNTCDRIAGGERCGVLGALRNKDARMGPTFMVVCFRHQQPTPRRNASQWLLGTFCHQKVQKNKER